MFNNPFCEKNIKKLSTGLGVCWGNGGTVLILSWKCNFNISLDIQVYYLDSHVINTLLCLLFVLYVLVPSIHSFFYPTATLLKSDVFRHSKAYSSHSFRPTGIGLGSLWRGYTYAYRKVYGKNYKLVKKNCNFFKLTMLPKKYVYFKKFPKIYYSFCFQNDFLYTYICSKSIYKYIFLISLKSYEE